MTIVTAVTVQPICNDAAILDSGYDVNHLNQIIYSGHGMKHPESLRRQKRARFDLMKEGTDAVTKLTSGAKRLRSYEKNVRQYRKDGNFQTAVEDFMALRPVSVREASYPPFQHKAVYGRVGDRFVQVVKVGQSRRPTITLIKQGEDGNSSTAVRIMYYRP